MNRQAKKPTKGEIERKIRSSVVFVPKDKETKCIYFDDKGLRITVTDDYAVIGTSAHQHVFNKLSLAGLSRPYIYAKRFVEIALDNNCMVVDNRGRNVRSYSKLFDVLKNKDDKTEYNIAWYVDIWLMNIFSPLYGIGEKDTQSLVVYEQYLHNIACQAVFLSEKTDGMTNLQYINQIMEKEKQFISDMEERVVFEPKKDEDLMNSEIEALQEENFENETNKEDDGK